MGGRCAGLPPIRGVLLTERRWPARFAVSVVLLGTVALRLRLLGVPLERDEGEYAYMAQLILRGEVPYLAAHNMKLPGVYYAYAGILALLGQTDVAIRLGLLAVNLLSIVLVYRLGCSRLDVTAGVVAAAAYAILSLGEGVFGFTANAEHFVVLPMLAGVLLLARLGPKRRWWSIAGAGVALGVAVLMKQQGAAFVAFGALWLLVGEGRHGAATWRRGAVESGVFALAAAAPFGLTCLGMYAAGAFAPFWFWTVTYAREYVSMIPVAVGLAELRGEAVRIASSSVSLWLLAALGLTTPWWDAQARRSAGFLGLFSACSFLAVAPGLRFSPHYFILLLPAASLLVGATVSGLARLRPAGASLVRVVVPLGAVVLSLVQARAYLFSRSPLAVARAAFGANPFPEAIEVARYLREHTGPEERVAVIGSEPEIYFYARRRAATSYLYTYPLMEAQPFAREMQGDMIAQLERERPRFLVLVNVDTSWSRRPDSSTALLDWAARVVNEQYDAVGLADIREGGTVYRWDGAARDAQPVSSSFIEIFERRGGR